MSFKIIVDSCCDLTAIQLQEGPFIRVPLVITVGGEDIVDDDTFDQTRLLMLMREDPKPPQTACPSPAQYIAAFEEAQADDIYVVTLSALLSGSHNSAAQARAIWMEEHPNSHVHVFNSCSANAGEVSIALKILELANSGKDFNTVVNETSRHITDMTTLFVLEDLDHLRKNGRLTGALAVVTSALKIKLLCHATPEGEIGKIGQALSVKQALAKMVSRIAADPTHRGKLLTMVHCNNVERAIYVRDLLLKSCHFRDILISDARGITTVYANDGGIMVAY